MIYSFPIFPTTTPLTGPSKGISLIPKHKDAPNNAAITGELSWSTDKTVLITCISFLNRSSNIGRIGRSMILAAKVASSVGLPSRLINPPGIFPTE